MSDQKLQVPNFEAPKCLADILFNCPDEILQQEWDRRTKAREKAKTDLLVGYYKKYYDRQPEMMLYKGMDEDLIPIVEESYRNSTYAFITINFDESKFDLAKVHKALMRKPFNYIKQWMCVYEYHTEEGHHPHIHMLIEKKPEYYARATKSKIISDFHRKFKDFVAGSEKVDVRMVRTPASKYSYILGKKKEKHKKENVTKDQIWRKSKGLADVYGSWDGIDFSNPAAIVGLVSGPPGPAQVVQEAQSTQNFIMEIVEPQDRYKDHVARQIVKPLEKYEADQVISKLFHLTEAERAKSELIERQRHLDEERRRSQVIAATPEERCRMYLEGAYDEFGNKPQECTDEQYHLSAMVHALTYGNEDFELRGDI